MKKYLAFFLVVLIAMIPCLAQAENGNTWDEAINQLVTEISAATG